MSVLLISGFLCLHFYEDSVLDEFNIHNWMLEEIVNDHRMSIKILPHIFNSSYSKSDEDIIKLYSWESDVSNLESLVANSSLKNARTSKQLIAKYGLDEDYLMHNGHISNLSQFKVLDGILNQSYPVIEELQKREMKKRQDDLHIIILKKQNRYTENEVYELELEVVKLYHDLSDIEFFIEINGKKDRVISFPYFLPKNTTSGILCGNLKDSVTGESRMINKKFFP